MKTIINRNSKTKKNKKRGFTIVELIAVMAIITILSAALVPKVANYISDAKKVSVLSDAKTIVTTFHSLALKDSSLKEDTAVSSLKSKEGADAITDKMAVKFGSLTVKDCIDILDTENYEFALEDGVVTNIKEIGSTE